MSGAATGGAVAVPTGPAPAGAVTQVWHGGAATPQAELDLRRTGLLSAAELDRARRLTPEAARLYLSSHVALRRILAARLDRDPAGLRFGRRACPQCADPGHGAPALTGPNAGASFNLTASGGSWLLAVTGHGPLGVDLATAAGPDPDRAAPLTLTPREREQLARLTDPADRRAAGLRAWSRKEAVLKAVGVGLAADLRAIEVDPELPGPVVVRFGVGAGPRRWLVQDLPVGQGRYAALARPFPATGRVSLVEYADPALSRPAAA
ncbi:4'-phosphopantetheinyl transferase [Kitasatospora gansuensis]|uniref:4'-phosphopantetheinyl transferase n=1 Tax=Kitasatospora gansuensis TaxID=258050 RepID=A0A7W7WIH8_9ACTN|nr:4'-phosphopantetheinyl transferase superfamily protein [Kitasatospora gansuensis]MBB4948271.1 4'-phosphopantetheinyl transferase [Kitasatospora gansuensis]